MDVRVPVQLSLGPDLGSDGGGRRGFHGKLRAQADQPPMRVESRDGSSSSETPHVLPHQSRFDQSIGQSAIQSKRSLYHGCSVSALAPSPMVGRGRGRKGKKWVEKWGPRQDGANETALGFSSWTVEGPSRGETSTYRATRLGCKRSQYQFSRDKVCL